jgi:hypothetical protein
VPGMHKVFRLVVDAKRAICVGIVFGALMGVASAALAATSESEIGLTPTVNGHTYETQSLMYTQEPGSPSDWGYTDLWTEGGGDVAAGWMGANARKFKNGSVCEQTGYQYNPYSNNLQGALADNTACGSGTYYSYGTIALWNGSGYNYYYSEQSPSLNG